MRLLVGNIVRLGKRSLIAGCFVRLAHVCRERGVGCDEDNKEVGGHETSLRGAPKVSAALIAAPFTGRELKNSPSLQAFGRETGTRAPS